MAKKRKSLGFGFADEVAKVTNKTAYFKKGEAPDWTDFLLPNYKTEDSSFGLQPEQTDWKNTWKVVFFLTFSLVLFFITFMRLFHLQIVEGAKNRELADGNRIQIKIIHAPRGVIFDRNGKILAANSPAFRFNSKRVTREQALEWEVKNDSRWTNLEVDNIRTYPEGEKFAHVIGYTGEISEEQLKSEPFKGYRLGDQIGKTGIEAEYEKILRGIDGGEIIEVDSKGKKLRTLRLKPPIPGQNIYLSIDASLQEKLFSLLKEEVTTAKSCCGAVVAADPGSGKILALVSFPVFDPNLFTKEIDESSINEIFSRSDSPILNRVIAGTYPPGSTFKIVSALAALSSEKINEKTTFLDEGIMYIGPYKFTNWYFNQYGKAEGLVNLAKALERSNDTYFYKASQIIGEKVIADWARRLFLGTKLGIDLAGEESGLIPDNEWKQKNYGQVWYPGDTLHMSIGQGFVLTTPLQILGITSFIAEDGVLYQPQLLLSQKPEILTSNLLPKEKISLVKAGLERVTKGAGTAWPFFAFPIETAGKTGTAEFGDPKNKTHAWYTSYAPADDPKIALTVLVEGGGEGSSVAAPIAKEAFRWYFSPDKNNLIKDIYVATDSGKTIGE